MSDNQSFLKMLGFDEAHEAPKENLLPEDLSPENSDSNTASATEWDLNEAEARENAASDEANVNEAAKDFSAEQEGWAESALDDLHKQEENTQTNEPIENEPTQTEALHLDSNEVTQEVSTADISHTELNTSLSVTPVRIEARPINGEHTVVYTDEEAGGRTNESTKTHKTTAEDSAVLLTKSIRARMKAITKSTIIFSSDSSEAENKTAHFNYDEEAAGSRIVLLEGKANTRALHISEFPIRFGRDPTNELVLDDVNVSRFHAEIQNQDGEIHIVDLGSTNGVKVNGLLVHDHVLKLHDVIQVGDSLLEYLPSGAISKGVPQTSAMQETSSGIGRQSKRRLVFVGIFAVILTAAFFLYGRRGAISEGAKNLPMKIAGESAATEIENIRGQMEKQFQKKVSELPPNELKKAFLDRIESSNISKLIPEGLKVNLSSLPPVVFKSLIEEPKIISEVVERGANAQALDYVLRERLNRMIEKNNYPDALALAEFLILSTPQDQSLQQAISQLKQALKKGGDPEPISRGYADLTDSEKKFYEYTDLYDRNYEELMLEKRYPQALAFAKLVRQKIGELLKLDASFERVGRSEIEKWDRLVAKTESKNHMAEKKVEEDHTAKVKGDEDIESIKLHLNLGEVAEAKSGIDAFIKKYPEHPRMAEVLTFKKEIQSGLEKSFATTRTTVDRFVRTESYENAWKELYRFLDIMPTHAEALQLKDEIEKVTMPKASQYYNQARVYEYEADDLVAAEQYYKKALDVSDPRSELAKKANRRYADVKRKNIQ
ncbi:MAG: hypothetical protein JWQ35_1492 [Bacteriovoracaceae bacterium]|nr:hypothetical protein [Bacteriovoracaceae bacterium]